MNTTWWQKTFKQDYLSFYEPLLTAERTHMEVEFMKQVLQLDAGQAVLDLPCGYGRHSIALAQEGVYVTGVDYSRVMLEKARSDAEKVGVSPRFMKGDMRSLSLTEGSFDAVVMMFTSFGYFSSDENDQVLREVYRVLKPGGRFLLDQQNCGVTIESILSSGVELEPGVNETVYRLSGRREGIERLRYHADTKVITMESVWNDADGTHSILSDMVQYSLEELCERMQAAGFEVEGRYGTFGGAVFAPHHDRAMVVGVKPMRS